MDRRKYLRLTGAVAAGSLIAGCTDDGDDDETGNDDENGTEDNSTSTENETDEENGGDGNGDEDHVEPVDPDPEEGEGILEVGVSATGGELDKLEQSLIAAERVHMTHDGSEDTYELSDIQGVDLTESSGEDDVLVFEPLTVEVGEYSGLRVDLHSGPVTIGELGQESELRHPDGGVLEFDSEVTVTEGETSQLFGVVTVILNDNGEYELQLAE